MHDHILASALCEFFSKEENEGTDGGGGGGFGASSSGKLSVIDLGCGMGEYVKAFRAAGLDANGLDGNPDTATLTQGR